MHQNLVYFWSMKTRIFSFVFHFRVLLYTLVYVDWHSIIVAGSEENQKRKKQLSLSSSRIFVFGKYIMAKVGSSTYFPRRFHQAHPFINYHT